MKRLLIALVSVAMLTAIGTVAWSSATEEQAAAPAADEMVTVTLLQRQDPLGVGDFRTRGLYQVILDRFALDVEARLMANQPFREQFKLIIAAGDMPDMLAGVSRTTIDELNQWGTDGLLYPVDTLMHVAPELQRFYAQYPDAADYNTAPDGHTYNIPGGYDTPIFYHGTAVRKDLLDSVGFDLDGVKDFDDYLDMYRALMEANDGKPVMSTRSGVGGLMALPTKAVGLDGPSTISFDDEADRFFFPYTSDAARFAVGWVRQLYEEGILHADALIHGEDDWEPDMGELVYPALFHDCVFCFTYNNEERYKREHPESMSNFVAVKPPEYQGELQPWRNRRVGTGHRDHLQLRYAGVEGGARHGHARLVPRRGRSRRLAVRHRGRGLGAARRPAAAALCPARQRVRLSRGVAVQGSRAPRSSRRGTRTGVTSSSQATSRRRRGSSAAST